MGLDLRADPITLTAALVDIPSESRHEQRIADEIESALRAQAQCEVRAGSVMQLGPAREPMDLILLDPPYGSGAGAVALDRLHRLGWIGEATWIALETANEEKVQVKALDIESERKAGKAKLTLLRLAAGK